LVHPCSTVNAVTISPYRYPDIDPESLFISGAFDFDVRSLASPAVASSTGACGCRGWKWKCWWYVSVGGGI
jgi:hypothetical protein